MQWGGSAHDEVRGIGTLVVRGSPFRGAPPQHVRIRNVAWVRGARRTLLGGKQLTSAIDTYVQMDDPEVPDGLYDKQSKQLVLAFQTVIEMPMLRAVAVPAPVSEVSSASGALWHARLAHSDAEKKRALQERGLIRSTANGPQSKGECEGCAIGKATCTPRERAPEGRALPAVGEKLHADLAFPTVVGLKGETCVLTTLDEGSRLAEVQHLCAKSQALKALLQLVADRKSAGKPVSTVHFDRGGEFTAYRLVKPLRAQGIKLEYSPAGQPKSNCKIERLHGTLMVRLRAVLSHQRVPLKMWSEVLGGVAYVHNRMPNDGIGGQILQELWGDEPLEGLRHLRVLGSTCYYRIANPGGKLAPRAQRGVLVGYGSGGRGRTAVYRVWDAQLQRVVDSADVDLDERAANGTTGTSSPQTTPPTPHFSGGGGGAPAWPAAGEPAGAGNGANAGGGAPVQAGAVPADALLDDHVHDEPPGLDAAPEHELPVEDAPAPDLPEDVMTTGEKGCAQGDRQHIYNITPPASSV